MSIKVNAGIPTPALTYDNIHITEVIFSESPSSDNNNPSSLVVTVYFKLYAIDTGNVRVYQNKVHKIDSLNFRQEADSKPGPNGIILRALMPALERMISILINDKGTVGNTGVE